VLKHYQLTIAFDSNKLASNPYLLLIGLLLAGYSIIIFLGFFNLINFIIHNFKKPLFAFEKQNKSLPLSQEGSSQLIFFILFLVFLVYFFQWLIIIFKLKINPISAILFFNLIVEVSVILLIIKYLKTGYLDFRLNKNRAVDTAKKYLTALPVLVGIIFVNNFVLEKLGIETTTNPAIELFLKIKGGFLLSLLMLQIVFFGPLAEELLFRGFVYKLLRKKCSFLVSATSSSLLFAALHRSSQDAFPLVILAIILCYVYEKTNNIATPILFHIIHNSLNISFLLLVKILT
jgi:membrane protease YdiL (CAAX protease family)